MKPKYEPKVGDVVRLVDLDGLMSNCNTPATDADIEGIREGATEVYDSNKTPRDSQSAYWDLRLIAKIDALTAERDAALARLKVAVEALEQIAGCSKPDVEVSSDSIEAENYIQNWAMTWDLANTAMRIIRHNAGPAKCSSIDGQCVHWRGAGGPVGECIYYGKQPKPARGGE